jgi:hypothetical protein
MSEMPPLSDDENALLDRYLGVYESLASGRRRPSTPAQQHFVDVVLSKNPIDRKLPLFRGGVGFRSGGPSRL